VRRRPPGAVCVSGLDRRKCGYDALRFEQPRVYRAATGHCVMPDTRDRDTEQNEQTELNDRTK